MMRSLFGQVPRSSYFKWSKVIPLHFPRHLSTVAYRKKYAQLIGVEGKRPQSVSLKLN